jgi:hypothetical protein
MRHELASELRPPRWSLSALFIAAAVNAVAAFFARVGVRGDE